MSNHEEQVKALRHCVSDEKGVTKCAGCPYYPDITGCMDRLHTDAAAAIEALNRLLDQNTQRCEALRKQLREAHENYERHLNELEAQLPKRGEWIYKPKDAIEMMFTLPKCSICGHESSDALNYCPNCGAKMEAQDGE